MAASLERILEEIVTLSPRDQERLLERLRSMLPLDVEEWARLKVAEDTFSFWDNESDADYDRL